MGRSRKPLWALCPPRVRIPPSPPDQNASVRVRFGFPFGTLIEGQSTRYELPHSGSHFRDLPVKLVAKTMLLTIILIALASLLLTAAVVAAYLQYSINRVPKVKGDGIKIACVGDSITQGIGVLFDQRHRNSYPSLLQE